MFHGMVRGWIGSVSTSEMGLKFVEAEDSFEFKFEKRKFLKIEKKKYAPLYCHAGGVGLC